MIPVLKIEIDLNWTFFIFQKVKEAVISDEFKPNSAAVTLGFLIRKGLVDPDQSKNSSSSLILFIMF